MSTATLGPDMLDEAHDRLRDEHPEPDPVQLSFFVGGATPDISLITVGGRMICKKELAKGAEVHVQAIDVETGEVVADGYGVVEGLSFKDKRDESGNVTETVRLHSAKVS